MMHGFGYGTFGWVGMIINLVVTIVVIIGIVWLVIWLVRRADAAGNSTMLPESHSPREILQSRYARGEITREQYLEILEDLNRS